MFVNGYKLTNYLASFYKQIWISRLRTQETQNASRNTQGDEVHKGAIDWWASHSNMQEKLEQYCFCAKIRFCM